MLRTRLATLVAALAFAVAAVGPATLAGAPPAGAQTGPQSAEPPGWILVDADTGDVLDGAAFREPRYTASLAKIMTALTAVERLPPESEIVASDLAASRTGSRIGLETGDVWTLEDGLAALILQSGNDMAYALAEAAGGDVAGFADALNETAARYGMTDTTLNDPAGFDAPGEAYGDGPRMSPFDVAVATRNAMSVPRLAAIAALGEYPFTDAAGVERVIANKNRLLPGGDRAYDGATGFKTGFTRQAGHTYVATAERDGRSLIAVVMGTWDFYGWATHLLDRGFTEPDLTGTGDRLPEVRVSPYAQREADREAFLALATGTAGARAVADPGPEVATGTDAPAGTAGGNGSGPPGDGRAGEADGTAGRSAAAESDGGAVAQAPEEAGETRPEASSGGGFPLRNLGFALLALLAVGVVLRRRAVRRQRARRLARQRDTRRAISRGQLPTVDGHHRLGTRTGSRVPVRAGGYRPDRPPPASHVQLHPLRDHDRELPPGRSVRTPRRPARPPARPPRRRD